MLSPVSKHISLAVLFRFCLLFALLFSTLEISAQSDYDSADYKDLYIDDEKKQQDEYVGENDEDENYFILKENRYYEWLPASQRNIPDSIKKKIKKEDAFWYADMTTKKPEKENHEKQSSAPVYKRSWLQTLIWIVIIVAFIAFLVIYLSGSSVGIFRKKNISISHEDAEEMPEDIFAINYQKEIDIAATKGNYRLAIRLMFLRLLKNMSERNIINYKQDKTNFDYLSELQTTPYYQPFFRITRNYEYSWYGQFDISENAYHSIRRDFDMFNQQWK